MAEQNIICKPTRDTFVRIAVMLAALVGFGLYFFYDGLVGYPKANEVYLSHRAFAELGKLAAEQPVDRPETRDAEAWRRLRESTPLFPTEREGESVFCLTAGGERVPLPSDAAVGTCPVETQDLAAMNRDWYACWQAYTARRGFPLKPADHPYTDSSVHEQLYAGSGCMLLALLLLAFMLRIARRRVELHGDLVTIGRESFRIADISCIDLRQWSKGFKGFARFTVGSRSIKFDGMTYGGFDPKKGEPAEALMQAILAQYKGDIIEYDHSADQSR